MPPVEQARATPLVLAATSQSLFSMSVNWASRAVFCCGVSLFHQARLTTCAWTAPETDSGRMCVVTSIHLPVLAEVAEVMPQEATPRCSAG